MNNSSIELVVGLQDGIELDLCFCIAVVTTCGNSPWPLTLGVFDPIVDDYNFGLHCQSRQLGFMTMRDFNTLDFDHVLWVLDMQFTVPTAHGVLDPQYLQHLWFHELQLH